MEKHLKTIVVSAINFTEGGPLTVLNECLKYLSHFVQTRSDFKVIALVFDKNICLYPDIEYLEIKDAKYSWLKRIYFEYYYFHRISKKTDITLWFSLHDMSPWVSARRRAVYCHNATPFYHLKFSDIRFSSKLVLFSLFYKFLYQINIKKNHYVVVQQSWMRYAFAQKYNLNKNKIVVAHPISKQKVKLTSNEENDCTIFFYPSLPRAFKNFEVIGQAVEILKRQGVKGFEVWLTIDGTENKYSRWVYKSFSAIKEIVFGGQITHEHVLDKYSKTSCLIFPSRLETWGLPISEFAVYDKPMILADLPYAKETASSSKLVSYFNPLDPHQLAHIMYRVIEGRLDSFSENLIEDIDEPYADSFKDIFNILLFDRK